MIHLLRPRTGTGKEVLERLGERFAPEQARGVSATVDLVLDTETGIERFQMQIENGQCSLARDRQQPAVTLRLALADLAGWIEGRADGANLFMSRRLMISGDVFLAVRLPDFFQLGRRHRIR